MTNNAHTHELQELYNNYKGKDLEAALGVTVRSIQNYLKKDNPAKPNDKVIDKIREAFAKHKEGIPLTQVEEPPATYKTGIDDLAHSNRILAESNSKMVDAILQKLSILDYLKTNLDKMPDSMGLMTDLALKNQEALTAKILEQFAELRKDVLSNAVSKKPLANQKR